MQNRMLAKFRVKNDTLKIELDEKKWELKLNEYMSNVFSWTTDLLGLYYVKRELSEKNNELQNLHQLLSQGFSFRLDEAVDSYTLIVSKGTSSISFNSLKEYGVTNLLLEAEDWAAEMLEELDKNNTI